MTQDFLEDSLPEQTLIVGCGYVGQEVARLIQPNRIVALTRSQARAEQLAALGIDSLVGNWLVAESLPDLTSFSRILVAVPHRAAEGFGEDTHVVGLRNLAARTQGASPRVVYLSTTGVYGSQTAEIVEEDTPTAPSRIGGEIAVRAENWLAMRAQDLVWDPITLRLAGIYGPDRLPLAEKIRRGEALTAQPDGFLNLIHVHDIARTVLKLLECKQTDRKLYVLSDGSPVRRSEFYAYLAGLYGLESPQFVPPDPEDTGQRRSGSKRVNPSRIVKELQLELEFPSYREGLQNILVQENAD